MIRAAGCVLFGLFLACISTMLEVIVKHHNSVIGCIVSVFVTIWYVSGLAMIFHDE